MNRMSGEIIPNFEVRKVDDLGRVVIPKSMIKHLDYEFRQELEYLVDGDVIILRKYNTTCIFCKTNVQINLYKNRPVCSNCLEELKSIKINE